MKEFFQYYKPYKGLFFLDFGSAVFVGILELVFPLITSIFIDQLLPTKNWSWIVIFVFLLLFIYVVESVLKFIVTYWGINWGLILKEIFVMSFMSIFKNEFWIL